MSNVNAFLSNLNLLNDIEKISEQRYQYNYSLGIIDFISLEQYNFEDFYNLHNEIWCENESEFFITIFEDNNVFICDSKSKLNRTDSIENIKIDSFIYGINDEKSKEYIDLLKKDKIDRGITLKEILKKIANNVRNPVDKDLLLKLSLCKKNIIKAIDMNLSDKEDFSQKIIDKSIFIRYLEDRLNISDFRDLLGRRNVIEIIHILQHYAKIINGDIFTNDDYFNINKEIIYELDKIFGNLYSHDNFQRTLVPYNFKKIPLELISNIYEELIDKEERKEKGIVYTPSNIVNYMVDKTNITEFMENGDNITILDPACGSGIFLIKMLDKIFSSKKKKLSIAEKINLIENCIYGIDLNKDAIRITNLSLNLKVLEDETPESINHYLRSKKKSFPKLIDNNLICGNSLLDNIFDNKKFDVIIGNPPWNAKFESHELKLLTKKSNFVSDHQSSQYFIFECKKWMRNTSVCSFVVNSSNFINSKAKTFREKFLEYFDISHFINLSDISEITFGKGEEPACIVIYKLVDDFTKINFINPDLTNFSKITNVIYDQNISQITKKELLAKDDLWHIYSLGYHDYIDIINKLDIIPYNTEDYFNFSQGLIIFSGKKGQELGLSKNEFYNRYFSEVKLDESYYPVINSIKGVSSYFGKKIDGYLLHGKHLERPRELDLFKNTKIIIARNWPLVAFCEHDTVLYDTNYNILKFKKEKKSKYDDLFVALLNSKLIDFYLGVKFLLREGGNFDKVNQNQLKLIPVPDLKINENLCNEIITMVKLYKKNRDKKLITKIDDLIYNLYGFTYYDILKINKFLVRKKAIIVTENDMDAYSKEFKEVFEPFLKEDYKMMSKSSISQYFGSIIKFSIVDKTEYKHDVNNELLDFLYEVDNKKLNFNKESILKEEVIKFYYENDLYLYKNNSSKFWTKVDALDDANNELSVLINNLE